jgi:hypothetical protein
MDTLGFTLHWNHRVQERAFAFQVSLVGFQLILNQAEAEARTETGQATAVCLLGSKTPKLRHFVGISVKGASRQLSSIGAAQLL